MANPEKYVEKEQMLTEALTERAVDLANDLANREGMSFLEAGNLAHGLLHQTAEELEEAGLSGDTPVTVIHPPITSG